jgi:hypothetical protein
MHFTQQTTTLAGCEYKHINGPAAVDARAAAAAANPHPPDVTSTLLLSFRRKTVDQYAEGSHNGIQHTNVNLEIDTVLTSLLENPDRKFIFVEQAFFQRWVEQQPDEVLAQMCNVVESGQLQFVNGGWSMHDESSPTYVDMVDQTTLGHRLISEQFGTDAVPKTTWQIDVSITATLSARPPIQ